MGQQLRMYKLEMSNRRAMVLGLARDRTMRGLGEAAGSLTVELKKTGGVGQRRRRSRERGRRRRPGQGEGQRWGWGWEWERDWEWEWEWECEWARRGRVGAKSLAAARLLITPARSRPVLKYW